MTQYSNFPKPFNEYQGNQNQQGSNLTPSDSGQTRYSSEGNAYLTGKHQYPQSATGTPSQPLWAGRNPYIRSAQPANPRSYRNPASASPWQSQLSSAPPQRYRHIAYPVNHPPRHNAPTPSSRPQVQPFSQANPYYQAKKRKRGVGRILIIWFALSMLSSILTPLVGALTTSSIFKSKHTYSPRFTHSVNTSLRSTDNPTLVPPPEPSAGFQNDSYQVPSQTDNAPELTIPSSVAEAQQLTQDNSFYDQPLAVPVRCELQPIDISAASKSELQSYLNEFSGCLARVWGPAVEASGHQLVRPKIIVYSGSINTPCGKIPENNAALCSKNQLIYFSSEISDTFPGRPRDQHYMAEAIVAHEYGHSLQAMTGMLTANYYLQAQEATEDGQYALNRRLEAQADCFAGEFVQAVSYSTNLTTDDQANLGSLFYTFGSRQPEVSDHGQNTSRERWFYTGLSAKTNASCNTWVVPDSEVP